MKYYKSIILMLNAIFLVTCEIIAQAPKEFDLRSDLISEKIPPLSVLIDSAIVNNASVRYRDIDILAGKYSLRESSHLWMKDIGIQSEIRYGTFDSYTSDITVNPIPAALATSHVETRLGCAAYLKIPLFDLLNNQNEKRLAKAKLDQAESMAIVQRDELRKMVIVQYNDLILKQRLFNIKSKNLETIKVNMQMVEKEFMNGVIPLTEYTRISGILSDAEAEFENARMDFLTAYMLLEEVVGMKFKVINPIPVTYEHN
jgi:outer membrane protein TolC